MNKYLIANWKSNMKYQEVKEYFTHFKDLKYENLNVSFAVPSIFLTTAKDNTNLPVIAQDVEYYDYGSNTGRISYQHLLDVAVNGSIIGHSEQRRFNDNSDEIINLKIKKLLQNNMQVILCIGEPLDINQNGGTINYLFNQLSINLKDVDLETNKNKIILAYEPIWSIGTGKIPTNDYIYDVVKQIKEKYDLDVLYGGSVNKNNIDNLKQISNLNGFLIGSGSIRPNDFIEMIKKYQ